MTAYDIIRRSLRWLGVIASNESPDSASVEDALTALNSLLQSFSTSPLMIFADSSDTINWTANTQSYTIGPSGAIVSPRPISVSDGSYVVYQGVSYPLLPLTNWDYYGIALKDQVKGIPTSYFIDTAMPNATIFLYPIPSQNMTLYLKSTKRLATWTLYDNISLPDGYERALAYCLAQEIAPEYEKQLTNDQIRLVMSAKRQIKRINSQVPRLDMPDGIPGGGNGLSAAYRFPVP